MFTTFLFILIVIYITFNVFTKMRVSVAELLFLVFCLIFVSSITVAPDVDNYFIEYTSKYYNPKDAGFYGYMLFFKQMGLDFFEFKTLHLMLCTVTLFIALKLMIPNINGVVFLYLCCPYLFNVVQIRNFAILSLVTLAYAFLLRLKRKIVVYIVWFVVIILASSFHIAALAFLPFVFLYDKDKFLQKMMLCLLVISVALVFLSNVFFAKFLISVLSFFDSSSRMDMYMERTAKFGPLFTILKALMMIYVSKKAYFITSIQSRFDIFKYESDLICITNRYSKNLFLYSSIFWPLYVWGGSFMRLMQNEYVLLYITFFSTVYVYKKIPTVIINYFKLNDALLKVIVVFVLFMILNIGSIAFPLDMLLEPIFGNLKFMYAFTISK